MSVSKNHLKLEIYTGNTFSFGEKLIKKYRGLKSRKKNTEIELSIINIFGGCLLIFNIHSMLLVVERDSGSGCTAM